MFYVIIFESQLKPISKLILFIFTRALLLYSKLPDSLLPSKFKKRGIALSSYSPPCQDK
jgi:hypothetical protein